METFPLTREEIMELKGFEREETIRAYHKWLYEKRANDKRKLHNVVTHNNWLKTKYSDEYDKRKVKRIAHCVDCGGKICRLALRCLTCAGLKRRGVLYLPSRKQFKTEENRAKQGSITSPTAWFIFAILILLIAYILSLPPEYRRLLLT